MLRRFLTSYSNVWWKTLLSHHRCAIVYTWQSLLVNYGCACYRTQCCSLVRCVLTSIRLKVSPTLRSGELWNMPISRLLLNHSPTPSTVNVVKTAKTWGRNYSWQLFSAFCFYTFLLRSVTIVQCLFLFFFVKRSRLASQFYQFACSMIYTDSNLTCL